MQEVNQLAESHIASRSETSTQLSFITKNLNFLNILYYVIKNVKSTFDVDYYKLKQEFIGRQISLKSIAQEIHYCLRINNPFFLTLYFRYLRSLHQRNDTIPINTFFPLCSKPGSLWKRPVCYGLLSLRFLHWKKKVK